jgi:hypothetical protein
MDSVRWIGVAAVAAIAVFLLLHLRDPHNTALPIGSTDLTPVKAQLEKLPPNERELVEEYVQRSHGDVLAPRFADPDNPLTARTFADAIALQRQWRDKQAVVQAGAAARMSERDGELAPLRAVVSASVAKRELLSQREIAARRENRADPGVGTDAYGAKQALPSDVQNVFAVTVALQDHEESDVVELTGSLMAQDRDAPLPFQVCWISVDEQTFVPASSRRDVLCANPEHQADAQQRALVEDTHGRFTLTWEPQHLKLRNGTVLNARPR